MSWYLLILLFFCYTFQPSLGNHEEKLPSAAAVVVGAVYCDTCSQNEFTKTSHFISGASVSMECSNGNLEPIFSKQVTTDEHGEFRFRLPFPVSKGVKEIEECSVKLISSNEPDCAVLSLAASSRIYLKANEQGKQVFSAGSLTFKPVKQPSLCNQNPSTLGTSNNINSRKISNPPTYKTSAIFPPIPFFTPPPLIPLPPIPGLTPPPAFPFPFPPIPGLTPPPPAFPFPLPPFPPIPGLTPSPPPPSLFPPIHFPPIPGFTPPSTPPPSFPFPLPPFPRPPPIQFPPIPGLTPPSPPPPSPPPPAFPFPLPPFPFPFPPPSPPPHSPSTKTNSP